MKKFASYVLTAIWIGMLSACVTRGEDFTSEFNWIKKDVSTKQEFKQRLGEPYMVGYGMGLATWTYGFYRFSLFGESMTKELKVYWSADGKVKDFSFSSNFPQDRAEQLQPSTSKKATPTQSEE